MWPPWFLFNCNKIGVTIKCLEIHLWNIIGLLQGLFLRCFIFCFSSSRTKSQHVLGLAQSSCIIGSKENCIFFRHDLRTPKNSLWLKTFYWTILFYIFAAANRQYLPRNNTKHCEKVQHREEACKCRPGNWTRRWAVKQGTMQLGVQHCTTRDVRHN